MGKEGKLKKPTTFSEQVSLLRSRGMVIEDEEKAISVLEKINYYRLSAYMLTYKIKDGSYGGASFQNVFSLYQFDKKLRNLILPALESIEVAFRTHIAYLIAHKYGALGYCNCQNFIVKSYHKEMLQIFSEEIGRSTEMFVTHHVKKYGGLFPIWVVIELVSFGVLSKIYSNLLDSDKDIIANFYNAKGAYVKTWLYSLSTLRNICAHYGRLYNRRMKITPRLFAADRKIGIKNDTVFASIYVIGRLSKDKMEWRHFVTKLAALIEEYEVVDLRCIGFPKDWETILRSF